MQETFLALTLNAIFFLIMYFILRNRKTFGVFITFFTVITFALFCGIALADIFSNELSLEDVFIRAIIIITLMSLAVYVMRRFLNNFDQYLDTLYILLEKFEYKDLYIDKSNKYKLFKTMLNDVDSKIDEINERNDHSDTVQNLSSISNELSATVEQQAVSLTEQSSALNQTASTIKELGVTADQTTDKATHVVSSAEKSMDISNKGHEAFKLSVDSMLEIRNKVERIAVQILELSSHTQKIGSIINTVDEIAETTNLLALNASIEASKAGKFGAGFQVVASEIRKLAEGSKRAVAEIANIIGEIQNATNSTVMATEEGTKGVDIGVDLIKNAGNLLEESITSLEDNLNSAQQILAANKQQKIGIDQITQAVSSVNIAVNEISAGTTQTKDAIKELADISNNLKDNII